MTNHVHLLVTPTGADSLSRAIHSLNSRYVHFINKREGRTESLWEGRYRAAVIDSEAYFLTCLRYVELNPVWAGLTDDPAAYLWSSYRWHALGKPDDLIHDHPLYRALGLTTRERQEAYADLVRAALADDTLKTIRSATQSNRPLGDHGFETRVGSEAPSLDEVVPGTEPDTEPGTEPDTGPGTEPGTTGRLELPHPAGNQYK